MPTNEGERRPDPTRFCYSTNQYTLTAVVSSPASPVGYRFYQGALGNTATLIVDTTQNYRMVTPPYRPISYWVRAYYTNNPTKCFADAGLTIN